MKCYAKYLKSESAAMPQCTTKAHDTHVYERIQDTWKAAYFGYIFAVARQQIPRARRKRKWHEMG
jgi:hypothetical protein